MKQISLSGNLMIIIATLIWGTAFVAQSISMDYIGPFAFISLRFLIGGVIVISVYLLMERFKKNKSGNVEKIPAVLTKKLFFSGFLCGVVLFISAALQQTGLIYTTPGKAGFITALYVVIVPIFGLFQKKKAHLNVWLGVGTAVFGMYLLCVNEGLAVNTGDLYVLVCAFFFAVHIMLVDCFSPQFDALLLSGLQFLTVGIISLIFMFIFERPPLSAIIDCAPYLLYTGVLSTGTAYTLQMYAQKSTDPTVAAMLFSLESVFAAISGWLFLNDTLSAKELMGCALVMAAVMLSQKPNRKKIRSR